MKSPPVLIDSLESRTLCSSSQLFAMGVHVGTPVVSQVLHADLPVNRNWLRQEQQALSDARASLATAIRQSSVNDPLVMAAQRTLDTARTASSATIQDDLAAIQAACATGTAMVQNDLAAMASHRNDPTRLAADRARLAAHRAQIAHDLAPLQARVRADRQAVVDAEQALRAATDSSPSVRAARASVALAETTLAACGPTTARTGLFISFNSGSSGSTLAFHLRL
jgi:hypothetical protein